MNKEHIGSNFGDFLKKEDFKDITSTFDDLVKWQNEEIQRLKAENDGLKSLLDFEIMNKETLIYNCEKFQEGNIKLKQALEDVREITKKYYLSDKKLLATGIEINPYGAIIEIQDKINEVLKDE